jgi:hypothetical protein
MVSSVDGSEEAVSSRFLDLPQQTHNKEILDEPFN